MFKNAINVGAKNSLALLKNIKSLSSFYLAGGTALSLQMGHRISYDLDFFTQEVFDSDKLLKSLNEVFKLHDVTITDGSLRGFTDDCEISFFLYQYPLINKKEIYDNIFLASIKDIALMKIIAIGSRGSKKDFYDLYFILKNYYSITDLFDSFPKKFGQNDLNEFHYIKSLTFFELADADDTKINFVSSSNGSRAYKVNVSWNEVKSFLKEQSKLL